MAKNFDRLRKVSRSYQANKDHKEFGLMDWDIYREKPRNLDRRDLYRGAIEKLSRRY